MQLMILMGFLLIIHLPWICSKNENPEQIFQELSYEELEERVIN